MFTLSNTTARLATARVRAFGLAAAVVGSVVLWGGVGDAQAQVSAIEAEELQVALQGARAKSERLERKIAELERKNEVLGKSLAASNGEAEQFRDSYQKLRERMEAFGIAALDPNSNSLQNKLIKALSDYRVTREENLKLVDAIDTLNAAVTAYMQTAISSGLKERLSLEVAIRETNQLVGGVAKPAPRGREADLQNAKVVSLKSEFDLIVLNVGRTSGVHVGMPFQVVRKDRPIGSALVIDVRDHICGLVIQNLVSTDETIQLGDIAKVEATKPL